MILLIQGFSSLRCNVGHLDAWRVSLRDRPCPGPCKAGAAGVLLVMAEGGRGSCTSRSWVSGRVPGLVQPPSPSSGPGKLQSQPAPGSPGRGGQVSGTGTQGTRREPLKKGLGRNEWGAPSFKNQTWPE